MHKNPAHDSNVHDTSPASHSIELEEGEEEDENVIMLWPNASTQNDAVPDSVSATESRCNPSRVRKPPEKWTYKSIRVEEM